jgi:hypothetical protein
MENYSLGHGNIVMYSSKTPGNSSYPLFQYFIAHGRCPTSRCCAYRLSRDAYRFSFSSTG